MMPSLLKYFTIVGGILVGLLIALNAVLEPGGPGPTLVNAAQPKAVAVRHDPAASRVERLRAEEAALKAAKAEPVTVTEPAPPSAPPAVTQAAVQPAPDMTAPAALTTEPAEGEAARAKRLAQEKIAAEKARKKRLARAKAKALEEASAQQVPQYQYGYAPRPTYGPFVQPQSPPSGGGWGQRW